jgi:hypothetical protein
MREGFESGTENVISWAGMVRYWNLRIYWKSKIVLRIPGKIQYPTLFFVKLARVKNQYPTLFFIFYFGPPVTS